MLDQAITPAEVSGASDSLTFKNSLLLDKISFAYAPDFKTVLNDITIEIKCGTRIVLNGTTGGEKSSLVDLIATRK